MADWGFVEPGAASAACGDAAETRAKLRALRAEMFGAGLDAVYLQRWANVAWLCGGRGNRVVLDSPEGQCAVLVTEGGAWLLLPNNEEARVRAEVFADLPIPVVTRSWMNLPLWLSVPALAGAEARWAADVPVAAGAGPAAGAATAPALSAETLVAPLRRRLGNADVARYRALGRDAAEALESALAETGPAWQELHVAAAIAAELKARDIEAPVVLVGGFERALSYRHLVPTAAPVGRALVASVTAVRHGLHASLTRSVCFGEAGAEIKEWHHAATVVAAAMLDASRPGATLGAAFKAAERAYGAAGYHDEWKEHHQGGTTGYAGREVFATPGSEVALEAGTAVAWNPMVPGAKSEDTALVTADGLELLTFAAGSRWPLVHPSGFEALPRPGIAVL
ncbi:MAG TPA: M24 family metallopeptidase [Candidatus Dormibacteraeota bacterium]|nr:M24 family metallopeptidase [Candidatus Dormibacteraeota bacterium]